jgi:hypothetical protein
MEIQMKYDVLIKGTLECEDDVDVDRDALADNLAEEIDTTDVDVDVDDDEEVTLTYTLNVSDVEVTEQGPA